MATSLDWNHVRTCMNVCDVLFFILSPVLCLKESILYIITVSKHFAAHTHTLYLCHGDTSGSIKFND